ncbi:MAG: hypothetical protein HY841_01150 [Bacteroidetes bacterium]|nr:hypothetical protein [Bacteroidota bacterium]
MIIQKHFFLTVSILLLPLIIFAQANSENGYHIPVKQGIVRVFLIFAEVSDNCPGYSKNYTPNPALWAPGQLPADKDNYFNTITPSQQGGLITDFLYEASHGQYIVLGDYYHQLVSVTCADILQYGKFGAIQNFLNNDPNFKTNSNLPIQLFAQWDIPASSYGTPNVPLATDQYVDGIAVIWRNVKAYSSTNCVNDAYAVPSRNNYITLPGMLGHDNFFEGSACYDDGWWLPFMVEFTHWMFGPNNFHGTGGGVGPHTFIPNYSNWFSTLGQAGGSLIMRMYNGWDRERTGWKNPAKNYLISALNDVGTTEVPTTFDISNQSSTANGIYILRNFSSSGDAIKIKLPYFNTSPPYTSVYNQYLWLENHQMTSPFDKDLITDVCTQQLRPGLYSYITVGKDVKTGTQSQVFNNAPMNLEGWFYPLSAEGNYDFKFRFDAIQPGTWQGCNWMNQNIPIDKYHPDTKPNPFTGHSDLFMYVDQQPQNGMYPTGDNNAIGLSEFLSDGVTVEHNWYASGDDEDAFNSAFSNNLKISLSSNPAPIPVYTHEFNGTPVIKSVLDARNYENRKIWLNGLSIEILSEDAFNDGSGALKIKVLWDNYTVDKNVRWCGDIMLSDFPPAGYGSGNPDYLNVLTGQTVLLDQGLSATRTATPITYNGQPLLNDPTLFTCLPGSHFHLENNSTVIVDNGSTLKLQNGSKLEIHNGAKVIVRNGGKLIMESGSQLGIHDGGQVFIDQGGTMEYDNSSIFLDGTNALIEIKGTLNIKPNATFSFSHSTPVGGYIKFSSAISLSDNIIAGTNSKIILNGNGPSDKVLEVIQESMYAGSLLATPLHFFL